MANLPSILKLHPTHIGTYSPQYYLQEEDLSKNLLELLESPYGFAILASEAVALLAMTPFVYLEICTVIEFGPSRWLSTWNLINMITYILQVFALRTCANTLSVILAAIPIHKHL